VTLKKLLIISDTNNWCFANRANALRKWAPPDWTVEQVACHAAKDLPKVVFEGTDVVFCLPTHYVGPLRRIFQVAKLPIPLVASHNSGLGRRWEWFLQAILSADYTICNNYATWMAARLQIQPQKLSCANISNGIDTETFRPLHVARPLRSVVWVSSQSKAGAEHPGECNVENDVKGYWTVLRSLKTLLENTGWKVNYVIRGYRNALTPDQMAQIYNANSFVVCASYAEGTPNFLLEAMACGCIPVTTNVGNVPELVKDGVNGHIVHDMLTRSFWAALERGIDGIDTMREHVLDSIHSWDWEYRVPYFFAVFDSLVDGRVPMPFTYLQEFEAAADDPIPRQKAAV